jgi:hypothetical protein
MPVGDGDGDPTLMAFCLRFPRCRLITVDEIGSGEVFYEMSRTDGDVTKSFEIRFSTDEDGVCRLWMF